MAYPLKLKDQVEGLGQGRFMGLECQDCGAYTFPAKAVCRQCGSRRLDTVEIESDGVIRTFTVVRVAPDGFEPPYIVALAELSQGPWVMGNIEGVSPDEAGLDLIGRKVVLGSRPVGTGSDGQVERRVLTFDLV